MTNPCSLLHLFPAEFFGSPYVTIFASAPGLPADQQPLLVGETEGVLVNGTFTFRSLALRARPGTVTLRVQSYLTEVKQPLLIDMKVLPCPIGTVPSIDGLQCEGCRTQTFSVWQAVEQVCGCLFPSWKRSRQVSVLLGSPLLYDCLFAGPRGTDCNHKLKHNWPSVASVHQWISSC